MARAETQLSEWENKQNASGPVIKPVNTHTRSLREQTFWPDLISQQIHQLVVGTMVVGTNNYLLSQAPSMETFEWTMELLLWPQTSSQ